MECVIVKLEVNETETLGDAILAGVGVGLISDPVGVATGMINKHKLFFPDPDHSARYGEMFALYKSFG